MPREKSSRSNRPPSNASKPYGQSGSSSQRKNSYQSTVLPTKSGSSRRNRDIPEPEPSRPSRRRPIRPTRQKTRLTRSIWTSASTQIREDAEDSSGHEEEGEHAEEAEEEDAEHTEIIEETDEEEGVERIKQIKEQLRVQEKIEIETPIEIDPFAFDKSPALFGYLEGRTYAPRKPPPSTPSNDDTQDVHSNDIASIVPNSEQSIPSSSNLLSRFNQFRTPDLTHSSQSQTSSDPLIPSTPSNFSTLSGLLNPFSSSQPYRPYNSSDSDAIKIQKLSAYDPIRNPYLFNHPDYRSDRADT